jgi:hypothetical protein
MRVCGRQAAVASQGHTLRRRFAQTTWLRSLNCLLQVSHHWSTCKIDHRVYCWLRISPGGRRCQVLQGNNATIKQELGSGWTCLLHIPCLVNECMMAGLNSTQINIHINNILVSCCVSQENAMEVMPVQFCTSHPCALDTHSGPKHL